MAALHSSVWANAEDTPVTGEFQSGRPWFQKVVVQLLHYGYQLSATTSSIDSSFIFLWAGFEPRDLVTHVQFHSFWRVSVVCTLIWVVKTDAHHGQEAQPIGAYYTLLVIIELLILRLPDTDNVSTSTNFWMILIQGILFYLITSISLYMYVICTVYGKERASHRIKWNNNAYFSYVQTYRPVKCSPSVYR